MKFGAIAIVLILFVVDTMADKYDDMVAEKYANNDTGYLGPSQEVCLAMSSLARTYMAERQAGNTSRVIVAIADGSAESRDLKREILRRAVQKPQVVSREWQLRYTDDFAVEIFEQCPALFARYL